MELYMDEKWKLSKKGSRNLGSSSMSAVASAASEACGGGAFLKVSMSMRERGRRRAAAGRSFSSRCASLVKEQRARFYIMRRCVTMLICWRDYP